jgi:hypothetical protein
MELFQNTYTLPRLNHEEVKNLIILITSNKTELEILIKEKPRSNILPNSKEKLIPILKLFQKIEEGILNTPTKPPLPWHKAR